MAQQINVTLRYQDRSLDLRLPTQIEVRRLIKELDQIFNGPSERTKYQLFALNKGILLDEGKYLSDYPLTTGDVLTILEDENRND